MNSIIKLFKYGEESCMSLSAHCFQSANEERQHVNLPLEFLNDLAQSQSVQEILNCTSYWVRKIFNADRASIALAKNETTLEVFSLTGNTVIPLGRVIPIQSTLVGRVYLSRALAICENNHSAEYIDCQWLAEGGLLSCMDAPLLSHDACYGTLNVAHSEQCRYQESDAQILTSIAQWVAAQIRVQKQIEDAKTLAGIDWLTGALNRRAFMEITDELSFKPSLKSHCHALLMIDIDNFKKINDQYGHLAGDEVLIMVSRAIRSAKREDDIFARIGGEEFVLLLKDVPHEVILKRAELHRTEIEKLFINLDDNKISCTISVGVATPIESDVSFRCILARADCALYRAKGDGKNRVIVAD